MNFKKLGYIAALVCMAAIFTGGLSVNAMAKSSSIRNKQTVTSKQITTSEETTEENTEMTTEEITTKKTSKSSSGTGSSGKSKGGSSRAAAKAETTTAEQTTKEQETVTTTEAATETTTEIPVDANGIPLSGMDLIIHNIKAETPKDDKAPVFTAQWKEEVVENNDYVLKQRDVKFENGDIFYMHRYNFKKNDQNNLVTGLSIPGSKIEIRYIDENNKWYMSSNIENTAYETMFIDTDKVSMIIGVPAVYMNDTTAATLVRVPEQEKKINITKEDGGYRLTYEFPRNKNVMGEIWVLRSNYKLADWSNAKNFEALSHDLSKERRLCWDGYYFPIPHNYKPNAPYMMYRHPSDYAGASFVKNATFLATKDLGYVITKICMENQNGLGYWQTGPQSEWLMSDFNIDAGFYDTRFNTDFAENLLSAYKTYNNEEFLDALVRYCEFFKSHAEQHSYQTANGGILVEDYGHTKNHTKTHVSLNHQLAELNLLYRMYDLTKHQPYLELADKMLLAIEDTKDQWVLPSNNLNYALHYTGTYNTMIDYPYLTYNDLYITRHLLRTYFNKNSDTVQYLMDCKLDWMKKNNVTGYYE